MEHRLPSGGRYLAFRELLRHAHHSTESLEKLASCCIQEFASESFVASVEAAPILETPHALRSSQDEITASDKASHGEDVGGNKQFRLLFMCAIGLWRPESEAIFLRHFFQQNSNSEQSYKESDNSADKPSNKTLKDCFRNLLSVGKGQASVIRGIAVIILVKLVVASTPPQSSQGIYLTVQRQEKIRRLLMGESKAPNLLRLLLECLDIVEINPASFKRKVEREKLEALSDTRIKHGLQEVLQERHDPVSVELQLAIFHYEICNLVFFSFGEMFEKSSELAFMFFESPVVLVARKNCTDWATDVTSTRQHYQARRINYTLKILRRVSSLKEVVEDPKCIRTLLSILDERLKRISSHSAATLITKSLWFLMDKDVVRCDGSFRMSLAYEMFSNLTDILYRKASDLQGSNSCMNVLPQIAQRLTSQLGSYGSTTNSACSKSCIYVFGPWRLLLNIIRASESTGVDSQHYINSVYRLCYNKVQSTRDFISKECTGACKAEALAQLKSRICDMHKRKSETVERLSTQLLPAAIGAVLLRRTGTLSHEGENFSQDVLDLLLLTSSVLSSEELREQIPVPERAYKIVLKEIEQSWTGLIEMDDTCSRLPLSGALAAFLQHCGEKAVAHTSNSRLDPYEASVVLMKAYENAQRENESVKQQLNSLRDDHQQTVEKLKTELQEAQDEKQELEKEIRRLKEENMAKNEAYQQIKKDKDYFERSWQQLQRHQQHEREQQEDDITRLRRELQQSGEENDKLKNQLKEKMKLEKQIKRLLSGNDTSSSRQDATEVLSQWIEASQNTTGLSHANDGHFSVNDEEIENALTNSEEEENTLGGQSDEQDTQVVNDLSRRFSYISPVSNRGSVSQNYVNGPAADFSSNGAPVTSASQHSQHACAAVYEEDDGEQVSSDVIYTQSRRGNKRPTRTPKSALRKQSTPATKRVTISSPVSRPQHRSQYQTHKKENNNSELWKAFEDVPVEEAVGEYETVGSRQPLQEHYATDGANGTGNKFIYSPSPVRTSKTRRVSSSAKKKQQSRNLERQSVGSRWNQHAHEEDDWLHYQQPQQQEDSPPRGASQYNSASPEDKENMLDALVTDITASTFHGYE